MRDLELKEKLRKIDAKLDLLWLALTLMAEQSGSDISSINPLSKAVGWKTAGKE